MTSFNVYNIMILEEGIFMKKNIIDYYALIMMILFIIYNTVLRDLKIGGLFYQIYMIVLIILDGLE